MNERYVVNVKYGFNGFSRPVLNKDEILQFNFLYNDHIWGFFPIDKIRR